MLLRKLCTISPMNIIELTFIDDFETSGHVLCCSSSFASWSHVVERNTAAACRVLVFSYEAESSETVLCILVDHWSNKRSLQSWMTETLLQSIVSLCAVLSLRWGELFVALRGEITDLTIVFPVAVNLESQNDQRKREEICGCLPFVLRLETLAEFTSKILRVLTQTTTLTQQFESTNATSNRLKRI